MSYLTVHQQDRAGQIGPQGAALQTMAWSSDLGWMAIAYYGNVLQGVVFGNASREKATRALMRNLGASTGTARFDRLASSQPPSDAIAALVDRLNRYSAGEQVDFRDVEIDVSHLTPFGRRVVAACRRIPRGQSRAYGQLATVCGSPGAARAVGQVMAKNRFPLVVPCHRVLAAGGGLGGFSAPSGIAMKRRLLAMEAMSISLI